MKKAKHRDGCERGVWSRYDLLCERCRETRKIEQARTHGAKTIDAEARR